MLELLQAEARRPFDLEHGPLIRASVVRMDKLDHAMVIVMHHAVTDGWSLDILFRELEASYRALAAGGPAPAFSALPIQYADYAQWQRGWMQGDVREKELLHWRQKLAGAPQALDLPTDPIHSPQPATKAARLTVEWPEQVRDQIVKLGQGEGATTFMVLMTALAITMHKWTGQSDMVLGTVVAGRNRREIEGLIGCFMNFLPLRVKISGSETGLDALRGVKAEVIEGQTHQECPFEKIVESVKVERRPGRNPLYNVALLFQNCPSVPQLGAGLESSPIAVHVDAPLLDLRFEANETVEGIALTCEYKSDLFDARTIEHLLASFGAVLELLAQSPRTKIMEFELKAELQRTLPQTIALGGTFTTEPLEEPLRFWLDELEIPSRIKFAPFDQVFQQLLDPASILATNRHGLNVLLIRLNDWESQAGSPNRPGASTFGQALKHNADEFVRAVHTAAARGGAPMLVCFCPSSPRAARDSSKSQALAELEAALAEAVGNINGVYVATTAELSARYPVADYDDPAGEDLGHIPYTPLFFTALAALIARKFHALQRPVAKVIALDCDRTLWDGVCGGDGPMGSFSNRTLTGYVVTTLYLMGPLSVVLSSFPLFGRARVALQKVQDLGVSLAGHSTEHCPVDKTEKERQFDRLELRGVVHSYHREQEDTSFVLGPIDLSLQPGELVFLVGGNGSGKSTLAKIITGLYLSEAGEIRLDGEPVTNQTRDAYRQLFSAVFADFFVFDNLLGLDGADLDSRAGGYLEQLHLKHKVRVTNGSLSTTAVSQGQRKRLALLTAYLEDRPFYLFDEWASDQDPLFKKVFYTKLLPDLKARGKAVLVITHDDRYFDMADRVIKLDYGKVAVEGEVVACGEERHEFAG
jgi:ABC-type multidrug transport system ATPase subunit